MSVWILITWASLSPCRKLLLNHRRRRRRWSSKRNPDPRGLGRDLWSPIENPRWQTRRAGKGVYEKCTLSTLKRTLCVSSFVSPLMASQSFDEGSFEYDLLWFYDKTAHVFMPLLSTSLNSAPIR